MLTKNSTQLAVTPEAGFTLVELMVALTAGLLVIGVAIKILLSALSSNSSSLGFIRFNQDFRGVMNMITHDLARAGSWGLATHLAQTSAKTDLQFSGNSGTVTVTSYQQGSTTVTNNAFAAPFTASALANRTLIFLLPPAVAGGTQTRYDLTINSLTDANNLSVAIPSGVTLPTTTIRAGSWTILNPFSAVTLNTAGDCVLFSYDLNNDGNVDTNESFGYRLDSANKAIASTTTASDVCTGGGSWQKITDENALNVTGFAVTKIAKAITAANLLNATVQEYSVQMTGQLFSDATAVRNLQETVKVRNDTFN
jgi:type II secretory pathway component PulJ